MNKWQISKTDTSYRFLNRWTTSNLEQKNFCSYYRLVMFTALKGFGIAVGLPAMLFAALLEFHLFPVPKPIPFWEFIPFVVLGFYGFALWLMAILLAGVGFLAGMLWLVLQTWEYFEHKSSGKPSQPSVIVTWFKAKKNKFCPLIEITGE